MTEPLREGKNFELNSISMVTHDIEKKLLSHYNMPKLKVNGAWQYPQAGRGSSAYLWHCDGKAWKAGLPGWAEIVEKWPVISVSVSFLHSILVAGRAVAW